MQKEIRSLTSRTDVAALLSHWKSVGAARMLAETLSIQRIPAPTFEERARAEFVHTRFMEIGLADIAIDDIGNVYGRLRGEGKHPAVMVSAHLDTVFPADTDLTLNTDQTA